MANERDNSRNTDQKLREREDEKKRIELKKQQLKQDRQALLKMPEFQRVMADILASGGMFRSVMTGNSSTFHLSGRQDFAREIWAAMAQANPDLAFDLLKPKFGEKIDV